MLKIKSSILSLCLFCQLAALHAFAGKTENEKAPEYGYMDIIVESNINKLFFSYDLEKNDLQDEKALFDNTAPGYTRITIPVKDFKCENKIAFNDFITLLKADKFPILTISIPLTMLSNPVGQDSVLIYNLMANIAGVTKIYNVACKIDNIGPGNCILAGKLTIRLSDLDIDPPVKYFGLVKVKNEVIVNFGVHLKDFCSFVLRNGEIEIQHQNTVWN